MTPTLAVAVREYRIRLRNIIFPLWDVLVPVVYLLIFGASFEHWIGDAAGVDYGTFFVGGVLAMVTFGIAMNSSYAFFEDLQSGIFHELLTYPFARRDLLLGKLIFNAGLSVIGAVLCIIAGVLTLNTRVIPGYLPQVLFWVLLGTAAWYFLFSWLALQLRGFNAYHTTTSAAYLLLMFVSNLFYPTSRLPGWIQWLAWANPITWQVDLLRYHTYREPAPYLWWEAAGFLLFTVASFWLANRKLNGTID